MQDVVNVVRYNRLRSVLVSEICCDRNTSGTFADCVFISVLISNRLLCSVSVSSLGSSALQLNLFLLRAALFPLSGVSACGFSMTLSPCACIMRSPPTPDLLH